MNGFAPAHSEAANSKVGLKSARITVVPSAPTIHFRTPTLTFKHHARIAAHEVPLMTLTPPLRSTVRILDPRGELSAHFPRQSSQDPRKVHPI